MITNTCLTGGSFEWDPPPAGPVDPLPEPLEPDGAEPLPEPDGLAAEALLEGLAAGVGSGAALGGSTLEEDAEGDEDEGEDKEAVLVGARMNLRCGRAEAASV